MTFPTDSLRDEQAFAESWQKVHAAIETGASLEAIAAIAPDFPVRVAHRLLPLHQTLRGLGLAAPDLADQGQRLVAVTETYVRLHFTDRSAEGRELLVDVTRNGNAFLSGRRYESSLSRVSLSDAEIARTNILKIDIDRTEGVIIVTFMTFDGRPARIVFNPACPIDPVVDGTIPQAAFDTLRQSAPAEGLRRLIALAIEATERDGASSGFWRRLTHRDLRRAYSDRQRLEALAASIADQPLTGEAWQRAAASFDILLARLGGDDLSGQLLSIRALIVVGIYRLTGEQAARQ